MLDCCICKRYPDIQELRTTVASQRTDNRFTITVRRPTAVLFRLGTVFVDGANVINPDVERHVIKSAENWRKKILQARENLPDLIINKDKWRWETMIDHGVDGIRDQLDFLCRQNWANLKIPFLADLLCRLLNVAWGHCVRLHV